MLSWCSLATIFALFALLDISSRAIALHVSQDVIDMCKPHAACAELGVWKGEVTHAFTQRRPQTLYLIDPWTYQVEEFPNRWFSGKMAKSQNDMDVIFQKVNATFGHLPHVRIIREKSEVALPALEANSLDFIYIDGNHEYAPVLDDLRNAKRVVKPGGVIAGDDYYWTNDTHFSCVKQAVADFAAESGLQAPALHNNGGVQFSFINTKATAV